MQLNMTTDYAVRLLLYLATVERRTSSQEIAKRMNIPSKYITAIVSKLKERSYIQTFQGSGGGYALACPPDTITLKDIVETMEGSVKIKRCAACDPKCDLHTGDFCPLSHAYDGVQKGIEDVLMQVTIQKLMDDRT